VSTVSRHSRDGARRLATSSASDTSTPASFEQMVDGLPVFVGQTATSGRGLYATRAVVRGEVVLRAAPLVAHPTLDNLGTVCCACLGRLPPHAHDAREKEGGWVPTHGGGDGGGAAGFFCGKACASAAWESYHAMETAAGNAMAPLVRHCAQHGLKFPLVVARLAFRVLSGSADAAAADALCHVNFPAGADPPAEWVEEHAMLRVALARGMAMHRVKGGGLDGDAHARLDRLTSEWYVGVTSRLHLNSFRCEVPPALELEPGTGAGTGVGVGVQAHAHAHSHSHGGVACTADHGEKKAQSHGHSHDGGETDCTADHGDHHAAPPPPPPPAPALGFREAMEAALVASAAGVGTGSALYTLPSLLNHSCDPSMVGL
jgi:hypothetical protein